MTDLKTRMATRIQLSTDGFRAYPSLVHEVFGENIDHGVLVKQYDGEEANGRRKRLRYIGSELKVAQGNPDIPHISTSYVERQNLTMRTQCKRYTRKTNAHSKKIDNHAHAVALHFMYYNFGRIHQTLRITPAMAAGISNRIWSIEEIVALSHA